MKLILLIVILSKYVIIINVIKESTENKNEITTIT